MNYKPLIYLCLFSLLLFTCEKDDICAEGSAITPQLIVTFFDETDPTEKKNVEDLVIVGLNNANEVVFTSSIITTDSIAFPLRTDSNMTKILFHSNYGIDNNDTPDDTTDDILLGNQDIIDYSYTRTDVYVSRACGFVANYIELTDNLAPDSDNWILNTEILKPNVENEIEAHVKIYH